MFPQVVDKDRGVFRQYMVNGVPTIGVSENTFYACQVLVDPDHQKRYAQVFVNGYQYPENAEYYAAFRELIKVRVSFSSSIAVSLNKLVSRAPHGYIIVYLHKDGAEKDGPKPMMEEQVQIPQLTNVREAVITDAILDYSELVARYFIRIVPWAELREVAQPTQHLSWGPPLTEEDRQITQFWSPKRAW